MAEDNLRYYETFYGVHVDDWTVDFGDRFVNHNKILVKDYISEGCSTTTSSTATNTIEFIFPHHIAKTYFIEGVISGHITLAASGCTTTVTKYRVSIRKLHQTDAGIDEQLFTTGWVTVNDTLGWDSTYNIGEEKVYPFWIDAWEKETLTDQERFYVRIEVDTDTCCVAWHSNDATWEDIKLEIPFIM